MPALPTESFFPYNTYICNVRRPQLDENGEGRRYDFDVKYIPQRDVYLYSMDGMIIFAMKCVQIDDGAPRILRKELTSPTSMTTCEPMWVIPKENVVVPISASAWKPVRFYILKKPLSLNEQVDIVAHVPCHVLPGQIQFKVIYEITNAKQKYVRRITSSFMEMVIDQTYKRKLGTLVNEVNHFNLHEVIFPLPNASGSTRDARDIRNFISMNYNIEVHIEFTEPYGVLDGFVPLYFLDSAATPNHFPGYTPAPNAYQY